MDNDNQNRMVMPFIHEANKDVSGKKYVFEKDAYLTDIDTLAIMNYNGALLKICNSKDYNYIYDLNTGVFARWGSEENINATCAPAPEIIDIEVSTVCNGNGTPCSWCYKSNTGVGKNMSYSTFENIFNRLPSTLTQIAFGIGDIDANPDLFDMFELCRRQAVVPNVTINGYRMNEDLYNRLAVTCGAISVSLYDKDVCYTAVDELYRRGCDQVNIHALLSEETYNDCISLLDDCKSDERLTGLNAVVFMMLKPKGSRNTFTTLSDPNKFKTLIDKANDLGIQIGSDSCAAPSMIRYYRDNFEEQEVRNIISSIEPCESGLFSLYINVEGKAYPCSFTEDGNGLDVTNSDFSDIWNSETLTVWRELLGNTTDKCSCIYSDRCRVCPAFKVGTCGNQS